MCVPSIKGPSKGRGFRWALWVLHCLLSGSLFSAVASSPASTTTLAVTVNGSSPTTVGPGSVVTLTATVQSGGSAITVGQVNFCDASSSYCSDIHLMGTAQLTSNGTAAMKFVPGVGSHSYKAVFVGTGSAASSSSVTSALTVTGPYQSSTSIAQTGSAGNYTLTATVSGVGATAPTGTVSFLDASSSNFALGTGTLVAASPGLSLINTPNAPTGSNPGLVLVADLNGDGKQDVVTQNGDGTLTVLLGNGDGTFSAVQNPTTGAVPTALAIGDFNMDGKPDLVGIVAEYTNMVVVLLGNGDGTFAAPTPPSSMGSGPGAAYQLLVGDFNGDGKPDLAAITEKNDPFGTSTEVALGNGDGTFTPAVGGAFRYNYPTAFAAGDFNEDGKLDLVVDTNFSTFDQLSVYLGVGDGTFTSSSQDLESIYPDLRYAGMLAVADFNSDGHLDIATLSGSGLVVLLGNGDGTFSSAIPTYTFLSQGSFQIGVADFNQDGKPDVVIAETEQYNFGLQVFPGKGDGSFDYLSGPSIGLKPSTVAVADFNGDGTPDLATAVGTSSESNTIFSAFLTQSAEATATLTNVSPVGTGTHQIQASYPGDSTYSSSVSSAIAVTALPMTTLALSAAPVSSIYGQQVVLTATLSPHSADGQSTDGELIAFSSGGTPVGTSALATGIATLNITTLAAGTDNLQATYAGDVNLAPSTSNTLAYTVIPLPAITFTLSNHTYGDGPFTIAATSNSNGAFSYSVISGPATVSGTTVTVTGAGAVVLEVSQAATGTYAAETQTASFMVSPAALTVTANDFARVFGAANPTFTATLSGVVNGDTFTETFSTTATVTNIVGIYPIAPTAAGPKISNYVVTLINGHLTISQAGTATTFSLSNQNQTLTATVASLTSGEPTGTVTFYEGQTAVGTGTIANGVASTTTASAPAGDVFITAEYSGDANFTQSASPPGLVLSVAAAAASVTVSQAGSVADPVSVSPAPGYVGTIQFSCSNLPLYSTCNFQPSSVVFTGSNSPASVLVTIETGVSGQAAQLHPPRVGTGTFPSALAVAIWVPNLCMLGLYRRRGRRSSKQARGLMVMLWLCVLCAGLSSCGGGGSSGSPHTSLTPAGPYAIRLVASGPNGLNQAINVTLTVQ